MITFFYIVSFLFFNLLFWAILVEYTTVWTLKSLIKFNEYFILKMNIIYFFFYLIIFFTAEFY